jgi:hypothetical protein
MNKLKSKVKCDGQECPLHTSGVGTRAVRNLVKRLAGHFFD